jgi:tetratricopeptide (TPR) repeat protein
MRYDDHLTADEIVALDRGTLSAAEKLAALLHLWVCGDCQDALKIADPERATRLYEHYFGSPAPPPPPAPDTPENAHCRNAFGWLKAALDAMTDGEVAWRELLLLPPEKRLLKALNLPRCQTLAVVLAGLASTRDAWQRDAAEAERRVELAICLLRQLEPAEYGRERLWDVAGRAFAYRANCRRILERYRHAMEDFARAERALGRGSGDPLEWAQLHSLRGSLLAELRHFEAARASFGLAASLYGRLDQKEPAAQLRLNIAYVLWASGKAREAAKILQQLLQRSEAKEFAPKLLLMAHNNLCVYLADGGRALEARTWLTRARRVVRQYGSRVDEMRTVWTAAIVDHRLGDLEPAERGYRRAQEFFLGKKLYYDAALASLDLARLLLEQRRTADVKELAAAMVPIFAAHEVDREAVAALMLFCQAVESESATVALVAATVEEVRRRAEKPARPLSPQ